MFRVAIISFITCLAPCAALGAEKWECTNHLIDGPSGSSSQATVEVDGSELRWTDPGYHSLYGDIGDVVSKFSVLENNDLGLIAVLPQARKDNDVGTVISAVVLVLNKRTGAVREGTVSIDGSSDVLTGIFHRK